MDITLIAFILLMALCFLLLNSFVIFLTMLVFNFNKKRKRLLFLLLTFTSLFLTISFYLIANFVLPFDLGELETSVLD